MNTWSRSLPISEKRIYDCGLQDLPASGGGPHKEGPNGHQISNSGSELSWDQGNQDNAAANNVMQYSSTALSKFIQHILHHPAVLRAPRWSQKELAVEVYDFILAHIQHSHDSRVLLGTPQETGNRGILQETQHNYFKWVRSVASDDTSCPMTFRFLTCLSGQPGVSLL